MRISHAFFAVVVGALLAGCGTTQKPGLGGVSVRPVTIQRVEAAPLDVQPETLRPLMSAVIKPSYRGARVPERPEVIGKLDVPLTREWKYIVVHHSAGDAGSEQIFDVEHRNRGWDSVGYDFVIGNGHGSRDGSIEVTVRWEKQKRGAHAGVDEYNKHGIGICLVGNFETGYPTEKQMASLVSLVSYLQEKCHIPTSNILLHRHIKNTKCPGENFPFYWFISLLPH